MERQAGKHQSGWMDSVGKYPKWRMIVCDDDPNVLQQAYEHFSGSYEMISALNGMEALEKLDLYEPDILVMDAQMPGVDGLSTSRAIRKNAKFSNLPIFMLSEKVNRELREAVDSSLISGYVTKPLDLKALRRTLEEYIERTSHEITEKKMTITAIQRREKQSPALEESASVGFEVKDGINTSNWDMDLPPSSTPAKSNGKMRIFVLDDDLSVVSYIKAVLEDEYDVQGDTNPINVMQKLRQYQPHLLLLDVVMPQLSGYQLIQLIRMDPELHTLPVILVTARADFEERQHAMSLGAAGLIAKPFQPERLLESIDKALCNV
ncbi:response regulator [Candidatus Sumerlaeota bacterium]|nr:response regulator [Candidatus Sumerlaeota bacterium]